VPADHKNTWHEHFIHDGFHDDAAAAIHSRTHPPTPLPFFFFFFFSSSSSSVIGLMGWITRRTAPWHAGGVDGGLHAVARSEPQRIERAAGVVRARDVAERHAVGRKNKSRVRQAIITRPWMAKRSTKKKKKERKNI
jgi:hypothetical protein